MDSGGTTTGPWNILFYQMEVSSDSGTWDNVLYKKECEKQLVFEKDGKNKKGFWSKAKTYND